MTRRADLVDQLEEQIGTLQNLYEATEQKHQTMLTVSSIQGVTGVLGEAIWTT